MFRSNTEIALALAVTGIGCALATYFFFKQEEDKARENRGDAVARPSITTSATAKTTTTAADATTADQPPMNADEVMKAIPASPGRKEKAKEEAKDRNAFLVHQMMVDPNFQLQHKEPSAIESHIKEVMKRAFWDGFTQDLQAGKYERVIVMLEEIRERLLGFVPRRADWRKELFDKMDTALLRQMLMGGAFDSASLTRTVVYIVSKIQQLEAPSRDEETQSWLAANIPKLSGSATPELILLLPSVFEFLFSKLDLIELDMANYQLQRLQPVIQKDGAEYQRRKFAEQLKSGEASLDKTAHWFRNGAAVEIAAAAAPQADMHVMDLAKLASNPPDVNAVTGETFRFLHTSLLQLVLDGAGATARATKAPAGAGATGATGAGASDEAHHELPAHAALVQELQRKSLEWAETLALETPQLLSLQADMLCVVRVGVAQMRILQTLPREGLTVDSAAELQDMHTKLMHAFLRPVPPQAKPVGSDGKYTKLIAGSGKPPPLPVIADRVIEVVQAVCANQGRTLSEASEGSLRASILEKLPLGLADPVYALVHKRFAAAICLHVEPARMVGKLKASGLDSSSKDLQSVVAQAGKIARRNFAIHGPIYIKLLRDFAISKQ